MELPSTMAFDYPTPSSLAGYIQSLVKVDEVFVQDIGKPSAAFVNDLQLIVSAHHSLDHIPRDELQKDSISRVPYFRWSESSDLGHSPLFGSFLAGSTEFDYSAFSMSKNESIFIDSQQRLLLQCAK